MKMVRILIPSHYQVESKSVGNQSYTVYTIEVYNDGKCHRVQRRYSDFHRLHKSLKYYHGQLPLFPPKKVRNRSAKLIEQRRQSLERYMQCLAKNAQKEHGAISKELCKFLDLPEEWTTNLTGVNTTTSNLTHFSLESKKEELDRLNEQRQFRHQSMIRFKSDLVNYARTDSCCSSNQSTRGSLSSELSSTCSVACRSIGSRSDSDSNRSNDDDASIRYDYQRATLTDIVLKGTLDAIYSNKGDFNYN